jgi:6 kDa early secretory antigenic target
VMSGELRVNHGSLDTAAADLSASVQGIDDRLNRLEAELAPLRADWSGEAQEAYVVAKAKWDQAMQHMKQVLADTSVSVAQSNTDYSAADKYGASLFS